MTGDLDFLKHPAGTPRWCQKCRQRWALRWHVADDLDGAALRFRFALCGVCKMASALRLESDKEEAA